MILLIATVLQGSTFVSVAGFICLCATGWLGGTLVHGHGLGMTAPPRA